MYAYVCACGIKSAGVCFCFQSQIFVKSKYPLMVSNENLNSRSCIDANAINKRIFLIN